MIDNLAEKFNSWSPYNYVLNNPLKYIDPDGNDVKVSIKNNNSTGRTVVTFTATMSVQNNAKVSDKVINERAQGVKNQIEKSFSGYDSKTNTEYRTVVKFDKSEKNFVLSFTEDVKGGNVFTAGKVDKIGDTKNNTMQVRVTANDQGSSYETESETNRTGAHEYGHTLGLQHGGQSGSDLKSVSEPNLMNSSNYTDNTNINNKQLNTAKNTVITNQNEEKKEVK